jgi:AmmeMemoRadiSam system protein B
MNMGRGFTVLITTLIICSVVAVILYRGVDDGSSVPVGIVVPHHDMVASTREAYLVEVAKQRQPKTIILLSPDHFDRAQFPVVTTDRIWQTSVGEIYPEGDLITELEIEVQDDLFSGEHGVTSLLREIKTHFPETTLLPILINRKATAEEVNSLVTNLYATCTDCLLVASVDFSHTSDALVADLHDKVTLRGLYAQDTALLYEKAEVDSPESLLALVKWSKLHGAHSFNLFAHTNSGFLAGVKSGEMTTHIMGGYTKQRAIKQAGLVTFQMGGDMMFARGVHHRLQADDAALLALGERFFWGSDISLVNLEGYFTNDVTENDWYKEPPLFSFYKNYVHVLRYLRINTVNVANNHAKDGGEKGFLESVQALRSSNIDVIGDSTDAAVAEVRIQEDQEVPVVVLSLYAHGQFENIIETIDAYSTQGYHVVVYVHWGEEYVPVHNQTQQKMAEDWIDAGADLVVGTHPHVVQDFSVYQGRPIVYSLGNMLFDQPALETRVGAIVNGYFTKDALGIFMVPIQTYLVPSVVKNAEYDIYVQEWTDTWGQYRNEDGYYVFPIK